ncbi:hypothetical protein BT69DRAFT_1269017 [Atractiella rhizophila]|nr:hypothetical protein BT69DRAFT_1269017 [Atractiella rhizophila]
MNINSAVRKLMRYTVHRVPHRLSTSKDGEELYMHELTSWKFQEWAYKKNPNPLPVLARGFFTEKLAKSQNTDVPGSFGENWRVLARGYDKFFNVGEVSWTKWEQISQYAKPPFYVTGKENGCIILISALPPPPNQPNTPPALLVTSKHATGDLKAMANPDKSHAAVGERWLQKYLRSLSPPRTAEELAQELYDQKITAVAELCDDSFEEHVLAYKPERTGLHLHGLNRNLTEFETLPIHEVDAFAKKWGFISPRWKTFNTVEEVKEFTDAVATDQQFEGDAIEGFVVRGTKIPQKENDGNAFFWKVKFDEPYLTYREWRELTKQLITEKKAKKKTPGKGVKNKRYRYQLTNLYVDWVDKEIDKHPEKFAEYMSNKGIIAVREEFLQWAETQAGKEAWGEFKGNIEAKREIKLVKKEKDKLMKDETPATGTERGKGKEKEKRKTDAPFDKTLIFPISIPGCGKTFLAVALKHLFGFAHTQSDDVQSKKNAAKTFLGNAEKLLKENKNKVVIADKNNHLRQHREQLGTLAKSLKNHHVRTIVLLFDVAAVPQDELHRICSDRIVSRGDNHQSLRPTAAGDHDQILWRFFKDFENFDDEVNPEDSEFDEVIRITIDQDMEVIVSAVANELSEILGLEKPSAEQIHDAILKAKDYKPDVMKEMKPTSSSSKKKGGPRYYGISVKVNLAQTVQEIFGKNPQLDRALFDQLASSNAFSSNPHVTLIHQGDLEKKTHPQNEEIWKHYEELAFKKPFEVQVTLGPRLLWDGRVMSIEVSNVEPKEKIRVGAAKTLHVTVGTIPEAKPIEGKFIYERHTMGQKTTEKGGDIKSYAVDPFTIAGQIQPMYN